MAATTGQAQPAAIGTANSPQNGPLEDGAPPQRQLN
jgi:hypothetical protein